MSNLDLIGADQRPYAKVHRFTLVELRHHVGFFRAKLDLGHVFQTRQRASTVAHDQFFKFADRAQVGISQQVELNQVSLRPTDGRQKVVAPQRRLHITRGQVQRGQPVGIDPNTHGDRTATLDGDTLNPRQCRHLRLQRAREPIGNSGNVPFCRRKTQVEGRIRPIGASYFHHGWLGCRGQLGAGLLQTRADLGERSRAAVVQFQLHRHGADAGPAGRLEVIDATDGRYDAFNRRGQKSAHRLGTGAIIGGRDHDGRTFYLRVLLDRQDSQRSQPHENDHEVHDHGEHGMFDEDIGEGAHVGPRRGDRTNDRRVFNNPRYS